MQQNTTDYIARLAFNTTKTYWKEFMGLPAAVSIVFIVATILINRIGINGPVVALFVVMNIAFLVFTISFGTATVKWCEEIFNGKKEFSIEAGLRYGLSRFWGVVGTGLLTALKVFLWTLLLVLPGCYKGLLYSQSIKVSQLEGISLGDANRISQMLVSKSGILRTLGNMMAIGITTTLSLYLLLILALGIAALTSLINTTLGGIVMGILFAALMVAMMTFMKVFHSYQYLLYREENKADLANLTKVLKQIA